MRVFLCLPLLLAGCSDSRDVMDELPNSSVAGMPREDVPESRMEAPLAQPVTIGEDGPRLDACGAVGQVIRTGQEGLALRAAPFADAREVARLTEGTRVHVCTRSHDQKWLGVVVAPTLSESADTGAQAEDCGVTSPVESRRPYAGPCASGWIASAFVRLIAG